MPRTWAPQMQNASETWSQVGPDSTSIHMGRFFDSVRTREPSVEDGSAGHHAAAVAHMVNQSIRTKMPVYWDWDKDTTKKG